MCVADIRHLLRGVAVNIVRYPRRHSNYRKADLTDIALSGLPFNERWLGVDGYTYHEAQVREDMYHVRSG